MILAVPLSTDYLPWMIYRRKSSRGRGPRKSARSGDKVSAEPSRLSSPRRCRVRQGMRVPQTLSIDDDQADGAFLTPTQQGQMIDLIRARPSRSRLAIQFPTHDSNVD